MQGMLSLDRNVSQATDSDGYVYRMTDQSRVKAKIRRKRRAKAYK